MSGRITRVRLAEAGSGETDWDRLRGLTDEEIEAAVADDPDSYLVDEDTISPVRGLIFRDSTGAWRWRLTGADGVAIADSPRGYADRAEVDRAIRSLRDLIVAAHNKLAA